MAKERNDPPVLVFQAPQGVWTFEDCAIFTVTPNGNLAVAVSEEQAVDSYNQLFECTRHLTPDEAKELRDWLIANFPDKDT